jgi:glucokinase
MVEPRYALGIDIGGTNVKLGIVRQDGTVESFQRFPSDAQGTSADAFITRLLGHVGGLLERNPHPLVGIGVSTHGFLNADNTAPIVCLATPALNGVNIPGLLKNAFGLPVALHNDLIAHTLAQYYYGVGRGVQRFMCLAIGTGLGAGVIVDGQPLTFCGGSSGDSGRLILVPGGPACSYGVSGSAEALCGTAAIERLALEQYGFAVPAHDVIAAAQRGDDPLALNIIAEIARAIGWTIASLCAMFQPQRVALTGGTAEAGRALLDPVVRRYEALAADYNRILSEVSAGTFGKVEIVLGEAREKSGLVGAVALLLQPGATA